MNRYMACIVPSSAEGCKSLSGTLSYWQGLCFAQEVLHRWDLGVEWPSVLDSRHTTPTLESPNEPCTHHIATACKRWYGILNLHLISVATARQA